MASPEPEKRDQGAVAAPASPDDEARRSIFFARAPPTVPHAELHELFSCHGRVLSLNLFRRWPTARNSKGCGVVVFASCEEAAACMAALDGRHRWPSSEAPLVVEWLDPSRQQSPLPAKGAATGGGAAPAGAAPTAAAGAMAQSAAHHVELLKSFGALKGRQPHASGAAAGACSSASGPLLPRHEAGACWSAPIESCCHAPVHVLPMLPRAKAAAAKAAVCTSNDGTNTADNHRLLADTLQPAGAAAASAGRSAAACAGAWHSSSGLWAAVPSPCGPWLPSGCSGSAEPPAAVSEPVHVMVLDNAWAATALAQQGPAGRGVCSGGCSGPVDSAGLSVGLTWHASLACAPAVDADASWSSNTLPGLPAPTPAGPTAPLDWLHQQPLMAGAACAPASQPLQYINLAGVGGSGGSGGGGAAAAAGALGAASPSEFTMPLAPDCVATVSGGMDLVSKLSGAELCIGCAGSTGPQLCVRGAPGEVEAACRMLLVLLDASAA